MGITMLAALMLLAGLGGSDTAAAQTVVLPANPILDRADNALAAGAMATATDGAGPVVSTVTVGAPTGDPLVSPVTIVFSEAIAPPGTFGVDDTGFTASSPVHSTSTNPEQVTFNITPPLAAGASVTITVPIISDLVATPNTTSATMVTATYYTAAPTAPTAVFLTHDTIELTFAQRMRGPTLDTDTTAAGLQISVTPAEGTLANLDAVFDGNTKFTIRVPGVLPSTAYTVTLPSTAANHNGVTAGSALTATATSQVATAEFVDALLLRVTFSEAVSVSSLPETISVTPTGSSVAYDAPVAAITPTSSTTIDLALRASVTTPAGYSLVLPASIDYADGAPSFDGGTVTATFGSPRFEATVRSPTEIRVTFGEHIRLTGTLSAPVAAEWLVDTTPLTRIATPTDTESYAAASAGPISGSVSLVLTVPEANAFSLASAPLVRYVPASGGAGIESVADGDDVASQTSALATNTQPPFVSGVSSLDATTTVVTFTQPVAGTTAIGDWTVTDTTGGTETERAVEMVGDGRNTVTELTILPSAPCLLDHDHARDSRGCDSGDGKCRILGLSGPKGRHSRRASRQRGCRS